MSNLLAYLIVPYAAYELTVRYVHGADYRNYRLFIHNGFLLSAYAVFYAFYLTHEFLSFKYNASGRQLGKVLWSNRSDSLVWVSWISFATSFTLFLIACLQTWPQSR